MYLYNYCKQKIKTFFNIFTFKFLKFSSKVLYTYCYIKEVVLLLIL